MQELERIRKYINSTNRASLDYAVKRFIRPNSNRKVRIAVGETVLFEDELQDTKIEFVGDFQSINLEDALRVGEL